MDCSDDISILDGTAPPSPETVHEDTSKGGGIALFNPCGLAVSATGRVYIADPGHPRGRVPDGDCLRVLAGSGARGYADGQGVEAAFAQVPAYQAKLEKIQADMRHLARRTASMRERSARLAEGERARDEAEEPG